MTISARAIALQGIGFAAALVAVQGLAPYAVEQIQQATPGYSAGLAAVRYQAADDATRRAVRVPALLRASDAQGRAAEPGPTIYRAASASRASAEPQRTTRTAALEGGRIADDPTNRRTARSSKT